MMFDTFGMAAGFGWIFMVLWWVLILVGIIALVKWITGAGTSAAGRDASTDALAILRARYARGEIDEQTFQRQKQQLSD